MILIDTRDQEKIKIGYGGCSVSTMAAEIVAAVKTIAEDMRRKAGDCTADMFTVAFLKAVSKGLCDDAEVEEEEDDDFDKKLQKLEDLSEKINNLQNLVGKVKEIMNDDKDEEFRRWFKQEE